MSEWSGCYPEEEGGGFIVIRHAIDGDDPIWEIFEYPTEEGLRGAWLKMVDTFD